MKLCIKFKEYVLPLPVFHCEISQKEGQYALCVLQTTVADIEKLCHGVYPAQDMKTEIFQVMNGDVCLFKGRLISNPIRSEDGLWYVELVAKPVDADAKMTALCDRLVAQDDHFEPAFYDKMTLADVLEGRQEIIYWDRLMHFVDVTSVLKGRHTKVIDDYYDMNISYGNTPLRQVAVCVEATWTQQYDGMIHLGAMIARAFSDGTINTLTADQLMKQWPKAGEMLGSKAYTVCKSRLYPLSAKQAPGLRWCTDKLSVNTPKKPERAVALRYKRFRADLRVLCHYRQKRCERVYFNVTQNQKDGKKRQLTFRLTGCEPYLESPSAVSLFQTARGQKFLNYARRVAESHRIFSQRQVEMTVTLPFDPYQGINVDTSFVLYHPDIQGGAFEGKVISYSLVMAASGWFVRVKIAGLWENEVLPVSQGPMVLTALDDTAENDRDPATWRAEDLVVSVDVRGDGFTQEEALKSPHDNYKDVLKSVPFDVQLQLKDLTPKPVIVREWQGV